jgi:hypothetical protein
VTELEKPGTGTKAARARRGNRRWPAIIGGLVLAAIKSDAMLKLILHPRSLIVLAAVGLAGSLLRARPVGIAVTASLLAALVLGAHSLGLGLTLGFGGFALLMAVFFAISTILHLRQGHRAGP